MTVNEATAIASRIESLVRRTSTFGKSLEDVIDELKDFSKDLRDYADRLDTEMAHELQKIFAA